MLGVSFCADFRRARRNGLIFASRVRPRFAPRGPGDIWESSLAVGIFMEMLPPIYFFFAEAPLSELTMRTDQKTR